MITPNPKRCVTLGARKVGLGHPAYIIAEAGVNHNGSLTRALKLVDIAVSSGADGVKFQWFKASELATQQAVTASYQSDSGGRIVTQQALLARLELSPQDFEAIRERCREQKIDFLATPFSVAALQQLLNLEPVAIKLASTDLNHVHLQEAAAESGLPLILSTGASTSEEIDAALSRLDRWNALDRSILLHCVSSYPVEWRHANLRAISSLHTRTGLPAGFSDHTVETHIGALAVAAGACILEKHFTYDRTAAGPDHSMSLDPAQLTEYIRLARGAEKALGTGELGYQETELEVRRLSRRSIVAARRIQANEILTPDLLVAKRPNGGIGPEFLEALVGRRARVCIATDQSLRWDMVE